MSYSNGIQTSHEVIGMDLTGSAAEDKVLSGPAGKTGRVTGISFLTTTGVTVTASKVQVGVSGGDLDAYAYSTVPIQAIGAVSNDVVDGEIIDGEGGNRIPADTKFAISNAGGSTAGVGNAVVSIEWS